MLFYGCLYIRYIYKWAPNTVFEDVQEIQPWCRITATMSQSHNELSTNAGCGPEQLAATVPCASVYSGCIAMARRTQLLVVFCKYSRALQASSMAEVEPAADIYITGSGAPAGDNPVQQFLSPPCCGSVWTSGSQSQSSFAPIPSQPWLR